jgi:hypothetical protein
MDFSTQYGADRSMTTTTPGGGGGATGPDLNSYLQQALIARLGDRQQQEAEDRAYLLQQRRAAAAPVAQQQAQPQMFMTGPAERPQERARIEMPWYSLQGAATRPVGLGAQMIPGMAVDPRLLPPSMRPNESRTEFAPSAINTAEMNLRNELAFGGKMAMDRARTANQTGEVGGASPGQVPHGTAPMLTPGNASTPPRQLSQEEQLRQRQMNSGYGRY